MERKTDFIMAEAWMTRMSNLPQSVNPLFVKPEEIKRLANEHVMCKRWINFWLGE
jgi:hypothetical protein